MKDHISSITLLRILIVVILTMMSIIGFTQTSYQQRHYQEGKIWFKLRDNQLLEQELSLKGENDVIDNKNLKLTTMPFLEKVFSSHLITRLSRPFPKAYSSTDLLNTYLLEFEDVENADMILTQLEASGAVEYAERVPLRRVSLTPNDPDYNASQMWGLYKINAENAWDIGTGSSSIVVAITDNAIDVNHPDLTNQIWVNSGEIPNNGLDDDGNGYVDDVNGYDVGDDDNDPTPLNGSFDHGTHVAGITGAQSNNNTGIASISYGITVMPIKITENAAGSNAITNGYEGIYYAAINGADIINCSWGGTGFSATEQSIINFAWDEGSIVVAAAGNSSNDNDVTPHYPSNYDNVIAVASSTSNDKKSSFSNYGATLVDITAPGSNIYSTTPFSSYGFQSGTSMAAPMVSGLLGLMKSLNPNMPNSDLINCMYTTADNIDGVNPSHAGELGAGRINASAAMSCVFSTLSNPPTADFTANYTTIYAGGTVTFTDQSTYGATSWSWNFDNQGLGGVSPSTASTQGPHTITYNTSGTYEVSLTVSNANGSDTETKTTYIVVNPLGACVTLNLDDPTFSSPQTGWHVGWTPIVYGAGAGNGYVSGTNIYGDRAKAEYFPATMVGSYQYVTGAYVWYAKAYAADPNTTIDINVYDATGGSIVSTLGTRTVTMGNTATSTGTLKYYQFSPAVAVPASAEIAVGVDFSNLSFPTDTLLLVTNTHNDPSNSIGIEQLSGGTWNNYFARWSANISHYIFPQLTNTPAVVNLSATPTTVCEGDIISYDATGSTFQDTLLWLFPGATPNYSSEITKDVVYHTAGNYKAYLEVIGGGCGNYAVDSVSITVNPKPNVTISSTTDTICSGNTITLNASGASSYLWSPGGSTANSINVSPTSTTTYNVTGTTAGCSDNSSKTIYVESTPVANATFSPLGGCTGTDVNFDGSASTGASNYSWSFPEGTPSIGSSTSPFPVVNFGVAGTHNYSLQVTNTCGSNTFNGSITINNLNVTANATNTSICSGQSVTLTGSGATSYTWDNGVTDGVAFTPTSTTTYTVTGTDTSGCSNTDQITVTVNPPPTVTANATSTSICSGQPVTLTGSGATSYTWDNGVTDGVAITPVSTTTYTVTGTDANGCVDTDQITVAVNSTLPVTANATSTSICSGQSVTLTGGGATSYTWDNGVTNGVAFTPTSTTTYTVTGVSGGCSNTDQITVTVNPSPTVTANATSTSICSGQSVTLTGSGATSYTWDNGVTDGVAITPASTTTYTVTGVSGGCSNTDQITVTVNTVDITTTTTVTQISANATPATYQWMDCGNGYVAITGETGQSYTPTSSGIYAVVVTQNGCTESSLCINFIVTGTKELADDRIVRVYPNPAQEAITVDLGGMNVGKLILLDTQGKLLYTSEVKNNKIMVIDLKDVSKGVYFLQILSKEGVTTYKVLKQ